MQSYMSRTGMLGPAGVVGCHLAVVLSMGMFGAAGMVRPCGLHRWPRWRCACASLTTPVPGAWWSSSPVVRSPGLLMPRRPCWQRKPCLSDACPVACHLRLAEVMLTGHEIGEENVEIYRESVEEPVLYQSKHTKSEEPGSLHGTPDFDLAV